MSLLVAEMFVRSQLKREEPELEKEAVSAGQVFDAGGRLVRGTGRVVQETASALGKGLEREVGGGAGKALRLGAEAAPTVGAVGLGAYGLESALGNPGQRWLAQKRMELSQRLRGEPATYNPGTGQWY